MIKKDLKYISLEDALKQLPPEGREFYREISELIEPKTFDGEALIEKIKKSKALGKISGERK
jgi:hypothetical protein